PQSYSGRSGFHRCADPQTKYEHAGGEVFCRWEGRSLVFTFLPGTGRFSVRLRARAPEWRARACGRRFLQRKLSALLGRLPAAQFGPTASSQPSSPGRVLPVPDGHTSESRVCRRGARRFWQLVANGGLLYRIWYYGDTPIRPGSDEFTLSH